MSRNDTQRGQAAVELAVFGAVLIFILGTIVRSGVSNGFAQNDSFTAMRMAMLASWQGTRQYPGFQQSQNVARNSATVMFVEDRLSPDFNKYGDLDRNPYIAQGSGTFTYNLFYPVDAAEAAANVPIMDLYINGQHFPLTTAVYTTTVLTPPSTCAEYAPGSCAYNQCARNKREWSGGYKLFYEIAANGATGNPAFSTSPPASCSSPHNALCSSLALLDANGNPTTDGLGASTNTNGVMQYDLMRLGDYSTSTGVLSSSQFSLGGPLRNYIAWQWAASLASDNGPSIGLDVDNQQYPQYDIDGRLKPVTIYAVNPSQNSVTVSYEDPDGGDIDSAWDKNSCGPKPGLQPTAEVYTFTQGDTYLQIQEGKLFNPETGQFVRSANKKDTIDLIQRTIQLSNNTQRFCAIPGSNQVPSSCLDPNSPYRLSTVACDNVTPNPVEVCIPPGSSDNCFSTEPNIKSTCYDETSNILFVRSRLQDLRGHYWFTGTAGNLGIN